MQLSSLLQYILGGSRKRVTFSTKFAEIGFNGAPFIFFVA